MPYSESRKARERRLRAKYRKKTAVTSIVTLVIGLVVGFVLCVMSVNHAGPMSRFLKIGPLSDSVSASISSTPVPSEAEENNDKLSISNFDGEPADISDLSDEERNGTVNSDDGSFEDFIAENADAIEAYAADEASSFSNIEAGDEDSFADPVGETDPEGDAEAFIANPEVQVGEVEVPEESAETEPESTPVVTAEPTPEPTPEVTPEPTPEPTPEAVEPVIVPYGQPCTLQAQIKGDGSERSTVTEDPYETLSLTLKVDAYKNPDYFQQQYATQYKLQGDEAAVEFDITLNGYTGATQIIPQNFLLITFIGSDPSITAQGYQLMDAEIAGKTEISISSDVTTKLYKRYPYSSEQGDMVYMVVTAYNDGVESVYWFEIQAPEPVETPAPETTEGEGAEAPAESAASSDGVSLTVGSQGEEVTKLQRALINLGLLKGTPDGKFGNYTATAVKEMQKRYGMEQTGVADQAFLDRLYAN